MDTVTRDHYRAVLRSIVMELVSLPPAGDGVDEVAICDDASGNYALMAIGWYANGQRALDPLLYLRLIEDQVWIEWNGTELDMEQRLIDAGIPPSAIIPGYLHPTERAMLLPA